MASAEKASSLIEAIIFLENEPVSVNKMVKISGLEKEEVLRAIEEVKIRYADHEHGIELVEMAGGYMFLPKKNLWEILKRFYGKKIMNGSPEQLWRLLQ